jgi:hypothetical protein
MQKDNAALEIIKDAVTPIESHAPNELTLASELAQKPYGTIDQFFLSYARFKDFPHLCVGDEHVYAH